MIEKEVIKGCKIKDVAIINPSKSELKNLGDINVSFVPMEAVSNDGVLLREEKRLLSEVKNGFTYFSDDDILFAKITPCMENGKGCIVESLINGIGFGSTEFYVIRANKDVINPKYLFHLLQSSQFRIQAASHMTGSAGQKRLPKNYLEEFELILPTLDQQKSIIQILDKAKALIDKRKQAIAKLDELVQAVFLDMFGDPSTNQKAYPIGTIKDLIVEAKYGTSKKANEGLGQFPYLRMNNITYQGYMDFRNLKYIDLDDKEQDKYLVQKGDLLFNRTNSKELVGKTAVFDHNERMAIAGYIVRIRTNEKGSPYFISGYLNSKHGKIVLQGMCKNIIGMANINAKELQNIPILIPPKELQDSFEKKFKEILQLKEKLLAQLQQLESNFQALLQKAFKGELTS